MGARFLYTPELGKPTAMDTCGFPMTYVRFSPFLTLFRLLENPKTLGISIAFPIFSNERAIPEKNTVAYGKPVDNPLSSFSSHPSAKSLFFLK